MFRLTVIYDNKANQDFTASWGFAVLVEKSHLPFFSVYNINVI